MVTEPSRRNTAGGKMVIRVFASTASDGLTLNANILQQQHHIDKRFYLWNVIYWLHYRKLIKYSQLFTKYGINSSKLETCSSSKFLRVQEYRHVLFQEIMNSPYSSQAANGVYTYPNTQCKNGQNSHTAPYYCKTNLFSQWQCIVLVIVFSLQELNA